MKKSDLYDAAWERIVALKSYKLISIRNNTFRLTRRGIEFLKHRDKEYYLGKILIMDKYKRTKYPDVFLECLNRYATILPKEWKAVKNVLLAGREIEYEDVKDEDYIIWREIIHSISTKYNLRESVVHRVCSYSLSKNTVGTKAPIDLPIKTLRKILSEIQDIEDKYSKKESDKGKNKRSYIVENLLELHLEEIIRRNFKMLFPDLEIIDNNQHYYTKDGNYIDILCKSQKDGSYVVIELKRDRPPSRALVQLLDYMNQIMEEFKTKNVRGFLICKNLDRRTKSALKAIRNKLKNPEDVSIIEFDLRVGVRKI